MASERMITAATIDELNRRSNDLQARVMDINEDANLTDDQVREAIDRLVAEIQAIPAEEAGKIGERRGLYVEKPYPLTQLEEAYLRGEVRLYTPKQYHRLEFRRRPLRPLMRVVRTREARPSRRRRASSAHGPPGRLDDPDKPEPPRGRLRAFLSRICGRRP